MARQQKAVLAKIDEHELDVNDLVRYLKLNGKYEQILEDMVRDHVTVLGAKTNGIEISSEEVQERFDQIRRVQGLHRTKATMAFLDNLGVSLDEFEVYLIELLMREKVVDDITSDSAVEDYFSLNSPEFDNIEVGHILLPSEGIARELVALLEDDPDSFQDLAREHSIDLETRDRGGVIGVVTRGALQSELEAKVFNSAAGDVLGPFPSADGSGFEIFKVIEKHPAKLDDSQKKQVARKLYDKWLEERAKDHRVEIM